MRHVYAQLDNPKWSGHGPGRAIMCEEPYENGFFHSTLADANRRLDACIAEAKAKGYVLVEQGRI